MALVLPLERRSWLLGGGPPLLRGRLRQCRTNSSPAPSGEHIQLAAGGRANLGQHAQGLVAGIVALALINLPEQIHVEHEQCAGTADL